MPERIGGWSGGWPLWSWPGFSRLDENRANDAGAPHRMLPNLNRVRIELPTMWLMESPERRGRREPILIVGPFAVHDCSLADFAPGCSLTEKLASAGRDVALTFWKSASPAMAGFGLDAYFADLNAALDDLGGKAALIGLCQGGWLAAAYAARFPQKVSALVLVGAPIDVEAAETALTRAVRKTAPATFAQWVTFGGGRVFGSTTLPLWTAGAEDPFAPEKALQHTADKVLCARYEAWNARTVDLPGLYFLQCVEWVFRENRLAAGRLPTLGRNVNLAAIAAPICVLAASADEIVAPAQATAIARLASRAKVETRIVDGGHLSLFLGRATLSAAWPEVARWLKAALEGGKRGAAGPTPPPR